MTQAQFESHYTRYTVNTDGVNENNELQLDISEDGFSNSTKRRPDLWSSSVRCLNVWYKSYPDYQYVPDAVGVEDKGCTTAFST